MDFSPIYEFFNQVDQFLDQDSYTFFEDWVAWLGEWVLAWYIKAKIWALKFSWGVAKAVLADYNVGAKLAEAFGMLPSQVASIATYLGVPQAVGTIIQAYVTKFSMRVLF
jgi:hypothetical protein